MNDKEKAIIELEVPEWQIGEEVSVYFPDTMRAKGKCKRKKTYSHIARGLQLIEDNLTQFDELFDKSACNGVGEFIDVHEVLVEAIEILKGEG